MGNVRVALPKWDKISNHTPLAVLMVASSSVVNCRLIGCHHCEHPCHILRSSCNRCHASRNAWNSRQSPSQHRLVCSHRHRLNYSCFAACLQRLECSSATRLDSSRSHHLDCSKPHAATASKLHTVATDFHGSCWLRFWKRKHLKNVRNCV